MPSAEAAGAVAGRTAAANDRLRRDRPVSGSVLAMRAQQSATAWLTGAGPLSDTFGRSVQAYSEAYCCGYDSFLARLAVWLADQRPTGYVPAGH